ncbi:hypothetical protein MNB_SV-13-227 [hydrothermal vent metagenome]|uniref:Uncharacterized protein n=1 Tax=hydrothermal vent metagenome TaxID=652676 RepID=A0A1W1D1Y1_9ZZZZ
MALALVIPKPSTEVVAKAFTNVLLCIFSSFYAKIDEEV